MGTGLAGARSGFVLLSEGSREGAGLSWCWCSLGNMCPARCAGLGGVSRGITAPSAPCCSSPPLPCSSRTPELSLSLQPSAQILLLLCLAM